MIELAVVDLNGTTVCDDGAVERALLEALAESGLEAHGPGVHQLPEVIAAARVAS